MKLKTRIGVSLLMVGAASLFTGCANSPIGEEPVAESFYHQAPTRTGPGYLKRYTIQPIPEAMVQNVYRPYSVEPVGERIIPNGTSLTPTLDHQLQTGISPYGPNTPCIRSLWF